MINIYIMTKEALDNKTSHVNWEKVKVTQTNDTAGQNTELVTVNEDLDDQDDQDDQDSKTRANLDYHRTCKLLAGLAVVVLVASFIRTRR